MLSRPEMACEKNIAVDATLPRRLRLKLDPPVMSTLLLTNGFGRVSDAGLTYSNCLTNSKSQASVSLWVVGSYTLRLDSFGVQLVDEGCRPDTCITSHQDH
jgi:hypothetical protein